MENNIVKNIIWKDIRWQNADVYRPEEYDESIVYVNDENKVNILDNTITGYNFDDNWKANYQSDWEKLKNFYHIKWWAYCYNIVPENK